MSTQRHLLGDVNSLAPDTDSQSQPADVCSQKQEAYNLDNDLLKRLDAFLRVQESETAKRQTLQSSLDRLLEAFTSPAQIHTPGDLSAEIRSGVSEELKPLLHAIIELLELSMRRGSTVLASSSNENEELVVMRPGRGDALHSLSSSQELPEDLPSTLPEILTKSVEELVGKRPANPALGYSTANNGSTRPRPQAWIPVTTGVLKL